LCGVLFGAVGPFLIIGVWSQQFAALTLEGGLSETAMKTIRVMGTLLGLAIATVGYLFPVVRFLVRVQASEDRQPLDANASARSSMIIPVIQRMLLAACLSGVALLGTWASAQWIPTWASQLAQDHKFVAGWADIGKTAKEYSQICSALGAIVGTILAALAGDQFGRRGAYCGMCLLSLATVLWMFQGHTSVGPSFLFAAFLSGGMTASFYGWLPLYLPELFGTKFRATGQGFSFNFGRILAAIGALQAGLLATAKPTVIWGHAFAGGYSLACSTMSLIYVVGMLLIWAVPETKGQPLPE